MLRSYCYATMWPIGRQHTKCNVTLLPIGIRHGNGGEEAEAATATVARCRCDNVATSSTTNGTTAVHASDVTSPTDDVMPTTPFPTASVFRRSTSGGAGHRSAAPS